uniref:IS256 family transposase n=1 Tax=Blastopirellula marina TaxID=124 RepID=UPI0003209FB4
MVVGLSPGGDDSESWRTFLRHLKERGLQGVRLITSDKCLGLVEALGEFFPEAAWQRCIVHFYRNVLKDVPRGKSRDVAAMLKAVHARTAASEKAEQVAEKLAALRLGNAAKCFRAGVQETLAYMNFPREHWTRLRSNNMLERIMKEIRRRTRVVGAFPDGQSALMLVAAGLRHIAGTHWGTRRYLDMDRLHEPEEREDHAE